MDGRVQGPVEKYIKENYGVDHVDMVTEPGPNKILADNTDNFLIENIKKRMVISVNHHGSKLVAIVGHFGCAGNPSGEEEQIEHLKKSKETVESFGLNTEIILLWINEYWEVEKIDMPPEFTDSNENEIVLEQR
ncbi:MAG: hypothetical protein HY219_01600 [Candidatus Staskawiczbacteria bacterium]|nr:hypothetical protein [Candidatus Staskawiczbacteria bacterium]